MLKLAGSRGLISQPAHVLKLQRLSFSSVSALRQAAGENTGKNSKEKPKNQLIWTKIKKAFTFTAATGLVVGATGLAGLVIYLVVSEIALPSGDTQIFNKVVSLVEKDENCQKLLEFENGFRLKAYGESIDYKEGSNTGSNWTRNRPIASTRRLDKNGKEHLFMRFHVESKTKVGTVQLESIQSDVLHPEFKYIYLDVPGEKRYYLVQPPKPPSANLGLNLNNGGFLGVKWGKN